MKRKLLVWICFISVLLCGFGPAYAEGVISNGWDHIIDVITLRGCTIGLRSDGRVVFAGKDLYGERLEQVSGWSGIARIELKWGPTIVGYKTDGSVVTTSRFDLASWRDIVSVDGFYDLVAGLHSDGTVSVTFFQNEKSDVDGLSSVSDWQDIKQILYAEGAVIGLHNDGTIVASDYNWAYAWGEDILSLNFWNHIERLEYNGNFVVGFRSDGTVLGFTNINDSWYDICSVSCGPDSFFGVRRDGTVAIDEANMEDERVSQLAAWDNIKALYLSDGFVPVGLCKDGTVKVVSEFNGLPYAFWDVSSWTGVTEIFYDPYCTIGLKEDGSIYATGGEFGRLDYINEIAKWTNINFVSICSDHVVGLSKDGTLVALGDNQYGQCNVASLLSEKEQPVSPDDYKSKELISLERYIDVVQNNYEDVYAVKEDGDVLRWDLFSNNKAFINGLSNVKKILPVGENTLICLKKNGTVVIANASDEFDAEIDQVIRSHMEECLAWNHIVDIQECYYTIFGLTESGEIVVTDSPLLTDFGQPWVFSEWKNIKKISAISNMAGQYSLLGLDASGTVHAVGFVNYWDGITQIKDFDCAPYVYLLLKTDGTVTAAGIDSDVASEEMVSVYDGVQAWDDIVQVCAGDAAAVGLKDNGTVVIAGRAPENVLSWNNIKEVYITPGNIVFGIQDNGRIECSYSGDEEYFVNLSAIESWTNIAKIDWIWDFPTKEVVVFGFKDDGRFVCSRIL